MNWFYLIDKPLNISSFDVIRILRKQLNIRKMWHTGTLDPLATGCMLVATGNYTKLIPYFEKDTKTYEFDIMLDGVTDSFDLGEPVHYIFEEKKQEFKNNLDQSKIQKIIDEHFTGNITQVPPKYSALKIDGKRAYDLARSGKNIEMKTREVDIQDIKILDFTYPKLTLRATVSAGTYIRSIAADLGNYIWSGGYISRLHRTQIWKLNISDAGELDNILPDNTLGIWKIFSNIATITLSDNILTDINHGKLVYGDFDYPKNQDLFVISRQQVSNIVYYNGDYIKPVRKI